MALQPRPHLAQRQVLVGAVGADLAQRHGLDEREVHAGAVSPANEIVDLVLVGVLERHRIDLHVQTGGLRRGDPVHHLGEIAPAGDRPELDRIKGIDGDVDAPDTGLGQLSGETGELRAVGGQRQLVEGAGVKVPRQRAYEAHDVAAHQRLATGEPQLAHPARHEGRAQAVQLLQAENVLLGQEGHVLGHAIDAAEIAAVGHRDAQIGDRPAEAVDERRAFRGCVELHPVPRPMAREAPVCSAAGLSINPGVHIAHMSIIIQDMRFFQYLLATAG